ncbi:MAG: pilus assembly protein PilM [Phycisphaerae bacterium]|nr:pilus assembly protein PilM [Phycisphaerae bacterium]
MLEFLKTKTGPIGLDIGGNSVKMLQLASDRGKTVVIAADEAHLSPEIWDDRQTARRAITAALKEILARGRFQKREVISCLPSSELIIKSLRLDTFNDEEVEKTIKSGIAERFGLKAETHEIRFISAGNIHQGDEIKNEIILFAIDKQSLKEHIEMLEEAGVTVAAIDTIPCALFRSLQRSLRRTADQEKANVFVDVGSGHTTVVIGKAGEIIFAKQIDIAGEQINRQVASRLGIGFDEAVHLRSKLREAEQTKEIEPAMRQIVVDSMNSVIDELAREISLCFSYYAVTFRGQRPSQVVFAGGEAYEQTLIDALKRHLGVEIEVTEPLRGFDLSKVDFPADKRGMLCEWAVAAGLCLKGMEMAGRDKVYERN